MTTTHADRYRATAQEALPGEEVLAVGIFTRVGGTAGALAGQLSGAAMIASRLKGRREAPGLPQNVALAVTADRIVAFAFKPKMSSIRLKGEVASWSRAGLVTTVEQRRLGDRITFAWPDGTTVRLDCPPALGSAKELNGTVLAVLGARPAG